MSYLDADKLWSSRYGWYWGRRARAQRRLTNLYRAGGVASAPFAARTREATQARPIQPVDAERVRAFHVANKIMRGEQTTSEEEGLLDDVEWERIRRAMMLHWQVEMDRRLEAERQGTTYQVGPTGQRRVFIRHPDQPSI